MNSFKVYLLLFLSLVVFSCSNDDESDNVLPLSSSEEQIRDVILRINQINSITSQFQSLGTSLIGGGLSGGRLEQDDLFDCEFFESFEELNDESSCGNLNIECNGDNIQYILDYGSGCTDPTSGFTNKGKIIMEFSLGFFSTGEFDYKITFEDLESEEVKLNGTIDYSMENIFDFESSTIDINYDLTALTDGETVEFDAALQFTTTVNFEDQTSSTSTTGDFAGSSAKGYSYDVDITSPLVSTSSCLIEEIYSFPIQGVESFVFREGGSTTNFTVDFGDGACDPFAQVSGDNINFQLDLTEVADL